MSRQNPANTVPIFSLPLVVFPGGQCSLRLFESRYLDMVRDCMRSRTGFVICTVLPHETSNDLAAVCAVGTMVRIFDFHTLPDGLLGIDVLGETRMHVDKTSVRHDGLILGQVRPIAHELETEVPAEFGLLSNLVAGVYSSRGDSTQLSQENLDNASWVGFRLAELLPFELAERQSMLEMTDPVQRLGFIAQQLERFRDDD